MLYSAFLKNNFNNLNVGEDFENTETIPLVGDQMTRMTFDSARYLGLALTLK